MRYYIAERRIGRTKIVHTMYNIDVHNTHYYYYMSDKPTVGYTVQSYRGRRCIAT